MSDLSKLSLAAAVAAQTAIDAGLTTRVYQPKNSISWVSIVGVPSAMVAQMQNFGFVLFPKGTRSPRIDMYRLDGGEAEHPGRCLCPQCIHRIPVSQ